MTLLFLHGAGDPTAADGSFTLLQGLIRRIDLSDTQVSVPIMPNPDSPDATAWSKAISSEISNLTEEAVIVTHSLGGSCTLQALSSGPPISIVKRLILIAPPHWGIDPDWSAESFILPKDYANGLKWLASIDFVYSEEDEVVPIQHMHYYLDDISWATSHTLSGVDHSFTQGDISALETLLRQSLSGTKGD